MLYHRIYHIVMKNIIKILDIPTELKRYSMEAVIIYAFLNQHRKLFRMHKHYLTLQKHQLFTTMQTMSNPSFYVGYTPYK